MEHTWAEYRDHQEDEADAGVEGPTDRRIQSGLAGSTKDRKEEPNCIEFSSFGMDHR